MIVEKKRFSLPEFSLESGARLQNVSLGFETYGTLNEARDNAILITHFFSGTSHAAGRYRESDAEPGYWEPLIGPGKAIDTDRFFVLSSDTLCNVNIGNPDVITTGPASVDPRTGLPFGRHFPVVTIGDFVELQMRLCESLGLKSLYAVGGPSMGGLQAMEWAARFPAFVSRVISAVAALIEVDAYLIATLNSWCAPILLDPMFNGGDYDPNAPPHAGLTQTFKLITLNALHPGWATRLFGRRIAEKSFDPRDALKNQFSVETALEQMASERARACDANSLLRIARAVQLFSITSRRDKLRAKFLVLPASSDLLMFPESIKQEVRLLQTQGLDVSVFEIKGDGGHLDGLNLIGLAAPAVREFLRS